MIAQLFSARWLRAWPAPVMASALLLLAGCRSSGRPDANGASAFATGKYRNLFAEAGHSRKEIRARVDAAFQQLFHGDPATQTVYYAAGANNNGPLAYVTDIKSRDVRTEGLSYGMMIAVQLNRKAEFDAIWNWSKTYLYIEATNHPSHGFFAWHATTNGVSIDDLVAPDGEEYYVMALYFAAGRWGNGRGIYNYRAEADQLLSRMRHRPVITGKVRRRGPGQGTVTGGPLFDEEHRMVLFSPSSERNRFTDPSYHLPAFYELWSRWGPAEDRQFWAEAAAASRDFFVRTVHPVSGLNPNYAHFDGTPVNLGRGAIFSYDAFRTAGNWSVDWSWWARDPRERELSDRLQTFFESQGLADYGCQFSLDGMRQIESRHAQGLVAINAVASLAATHPRSKDFVEALWDTPVPNGIERYYEGLLYLMALLHCSGEFRIWTPHGS